MTLSVEYLKKLGACWTAAQLAAAAESWPSPTPTWAWFLGERLSSMPRADAALRVTVACSHIGFARLRAPERPGVILRFARKCSDEQLQALCVALGAWLDSTEAIGADASSAFEALSVVLAEPLPEIVEVAP